MANTKKTTAKASSKKTVKTAKPAAKKTAAKKATPSKKTVATKKATPAKKAVKSVAKAAPKKAPVKKTVVAKKPAPVAKKTPAKKAVTLTSAPKKSAMGKGLGALLSSEGIPENKRDSVVELLLNSRSMTSLLTTVSPVRYLMMRHLMSSLHQSRRMALSSLSSYSVKATVI